MEGSKITALIDSLYLQPKGGRINSVPLYKILELIIIIIEMHGGQIMVQL